MANLPFEREGVKFSKIGLVNPGGYQETRMRQFHDTLGEYLDHA